MPAEAPSTIRRETVAMERTLADVRLILWLATVATTLVTTVATAGTPVSEGLGDDRWVVTILAIFLIYSLVMWMIVRSHYGLLRQAMLVSSFIEVVLISGLIAASYRPLTPFYLWYVFYVVSISLRYGLQISILGLAASIVMYTAVSTSPANPVIYVPAFLGYTGFLFVLAFLFGHMSERQHSYQTRLAVANELGVALASLSTSREIISMLVSETASVLGAGKSWFTPHREDGGADASSIALGISDEELARVAGSMGEWSAPRVLERRRILVSNNRRRDPRLPADLAKLLSVKSLAAVPLYVREVPVGVLYAADKYPHGFSGYDAELLELVAAQAAPLIENIQLWERLKEAAASEERLRIARDLHDSFLQTLSAIKLHLERCRLLIDRDAEKAKSSVERLHEISAQGLADVRSYLSQLRLMGPEPSRFGQAAERCALEAAAHGGLAAHTEIDVGEDVLTPQLSLAAFQILRELSYNVVKHARASSIWVTAVESAGLLRLEVKDDGVGFDLQDGRRASEDGHLGLLGIEERVKELGGTMDVQMRPGGGAAVRVLLPVRSAGERP